MPDVRPTTRDGRKEWAARRHRDPFQRPRDGWQLVPGFRTERWEKRDPVTGRVETVTKLPDPATLYTALDLRRGRDHRAALYPVGPSVSPAGQAWSYEVSENQQLLACADAPTRGDAMEAAAAVPPFEPSGWQHFEAGAFDDGRLDGSPELWRRQYAAGFELRVELIDGRYGWSISFPGSWEFDMDYAWGECDALEWAKAAAEASWKLGPHENAGDTEIDLDKINAELAALQLTNIGGEDHAT